MIRIVVKHMVDASSSSSPKSTTKWKVLIALLQARDKMSRPGSLEENNGAKHRQSCESPMLGMNCCRCASLGGEKISQMPKRLNLGLKSVEHNVMVSINIGSIFCT